MFAFLVVLFVANFMAAENFIIPSLDENSMGSIQTSSSQNIIETSLGSGMSTSAMQSMTGNILETAETLQETIKDVETPVETLVEESIQNVENLQTTAENVSEIIEDITDMESLPTNIENYSENIELMSENVQDIISSPMESIDSTLNTETILTEMASTPSMTPTMAENYLTDEIISEKIGEINSGIPSLPMNMLSPMQHIQNIEEIESTMGNLSPSVSSYLPNMLSPAVEELESMSEIENLMSYPPGMSPMPPMMSTLEEIESQMDNYSSPLMGTIPGSGNLKPLMPYSFRMGPSPYPSKMGSLISPMSAIEGLESQINEYSSPIMRPMSLSGNMPPMMPPLSSMPTPSPSSTIQELESEINEYSSPLMEMIPSSGIIPQMPYSSNMGLPSMTSTIEELGSEIEEYSSPLMETMPNIENLTPLIPSSMGSVPTMTSTTEEIESLSGYKPPLMETLPNIDNMTPLLPRPPIMPPSMQEVESQLNEFSPFMKPMPKMGSLLPLMQKPPMMGKYPTNLENKENIQPLETTVSPSSSGNLGNMFNFGSKLPFMNNIISPFQRLPFMNRLSPPMNSSPSLQQSLTMPQGRQPFLPSNSLMSPLSQLMSSYKSIPNFMQSPFKNMPTNSNTNSAEIAELNELINQDSWLPTSEKNQFLQQISNLGPSPLGMMHNIYSMLSGEWQNRLHHKLEMVEKVREELMRAIEAMMSGNEQLMRERIMSVISMLGNSPISTALRFALNQDSNMLFLMSNISRLILERIQ